MYPSQELFCQTLLQSVQSLLIQSIRQRKHVCSLLDLLTRITILIPVRLSRRPQKGGCLPAAKFLLLQERKNGHFTVSPLAYSCCAMQVCYEQILIYSVSLSSTVTTQKANLKPFSLVVSNLPVEHYSMDLESS